MSVDGTLPTCTIGEIESKKMIYADLRSEIVCLVELRQRLIELILTFAAALLSAAVAYPTHPSIALIYPPIAALLAIAWAQRNDIIGVMCNFIKDNVECSMACEGWSTYLAKNGGITGKGLIVLSYGGIIVSSQVFAIIVGTFEFKCTNPEMVLVGFDILAICIVIYLIYRGLKRSVTC